MQEQSNMQKGDLSFDLDLRYVPAGIYMLTLTEGENIVTKRVIKK